MAATKTKPRTTKAAAKAPAKKTAAKKPAAKKKADEAKAAKPKKPAVLLEEGQFAKFLGYKADVSDDERAFDPDEVVYIAEVEESEDGVLYTAISADDVEAYLADAEDENVNGGQVASNEVVGLKGSALDKAVEAYMPIAVIGKLEELLDEHGSDPVEVARDLNQSIQESYFWMGGALAMALKQNVFAEEFPGEDGFNEFCQANFGFKGSKGRQLARVYTTFSKIEGFDPATLDAVGWSKAAIAERFVTEDNVEEVLQIAQDTTQRDLAVELKEKFAEDGKTASGKSASRGASIVKQKLTFSVDEDVADAINLTIAACMKQEGLKEGQEAVALERICVEWAQENVEAVTQKKRINSKANAAKKKREKAVA